MKRLKILVACEYSGRVRDAFNNLGHKATSCDLLPTDVKGRHYQGDVMQIINDGWDLMVAHPPCTFLTVSAARWYYHPDDKHLPIALRRPHPSYPNRKQDQIDSVEFVKTLFNSSIKKIAVENPIGVLSTQWKKPSQIIQPWQFGHGETKATCLWLKNLPCLVPTDIKRERAQRIFNLPPSADRWKLRSLTFQGIANAMASQWGV